jgi:hypothetical protein
MGGVVAADTKDPVDRVLGILSIDRQRNRCRGIE